MSVYRDDVVGRRDVIGRPGVPDDGVNYIQKPFSVKALATKVHELPGQ